MNKATIWVGSIVIVLIACAITFTLFMRNEAAIAPEVTSDDIHISIVSIEKLQNDTSYVTVEITNNSDYTIESNRLLITGTPQSEGIETTSNKGEKADGGGEISANDPHKALFVEELEGSFDSIGSKETVKIGFNVHSSLEFTAPLYVVFETWSIRSENTETTRAIRVTEPLTL